jgi:hypothetical protein
MIKPSLSVDHAAPSLVRNEAPALSSPPKPREPSDRPGSYGDGLPLLIVVDPRTMKVVDRIEGAGDYYSLEQLASANAK